MTLRDGFTLFTIRGLKARVLKLILGTPLLLIGVGLVSLGLDGSGIESLVPILIGAIFGLAGARYCLGAVRSDEFEFTISSGSGGQDGSEA